MIINDRIYGKAKITEPAILELIKSPALQRLKKISQYGMPDKYYYYYEKNYHRYEHSVGVMLLLKRLGADLEEQIAGLLHDVSVLAFSHVADWVFSEGSKGAEGYHDSIHKDFIKKTEIPKILKKHKIPVERVIDEENYSLLERKRPALCADRIDYALREFTELPDAKPTKYFIDTLTAYNGEIVFTDLQAALAFSENFLTLMTNHWGGYEQMIRYHLFSNALLKALEIGTVSEKDFYDVEEAILQKIENCADREIQNTLKLLAKNDLRDLERNSGKKVFKKFRYVDPTVLIDGTPKNASVWEPKLKKLIEKHRRINKKGVEV